MLFFEITWKNATEVLNPAKFMHMLSFAQVNNPLEGIMFMYSCAQISGTWKLKSIPIRQYTSERSKLLTWPSVGLENVVQHNFIRAYVWMQKKERFFLLGPLSQQILFLGCAGFCSQDPSVSSCEMNPCWETQRLHAFAILSKDIMSSTLVYPPFSWLSFLYI